MSSISLTNLFPLILLLTITITTIATPPTVYEVMQSYDFPVGLLPKGVTHYELDPTTGQFAVYLNKTCKFSIDDYDLQYKSKITGTISKDRIKNLKGIQVKVVLFWINIVEVVKESDELEFSVGLVSADFALDSFYESPQCGCGFDCTGEGKVTKGGFGLKGFGYLFEML